MIRYIAVLLVALVSFLANAQPTPQPTKCGEAATGYKYGTNERVTLDAAGAKYLQVGLDGVWKFCDPEPRKPRLPASCVVPYQTWSTGDYSCFGVPTQPTLKHGAVGVVRTKPGPTEGVIILQCDDGVLSERVSACDPTAACIASSYSSSDDGGRTVWAWQGSLPEGGRSAAYGPNGKTRPIMCLGGRLRLL